MIACLCSTSQSEIVSLRYRLRTNAGRLVRPGLFAICIIYEQAVGRYRPVGEGGIRRDFLVLGWVVGLV
jgi:hypothetical protein